MGSSKSPTPAPAPPPPEQEPFDQTVDLDKKAAAQYSAANYIDKADKQDAASKKRKKMGDASPTSSGLAIG